MKTAEQWAVLVNEALNPPYGVFKAYSPMVKQMFELCAKEARDTALEEAANAATLWEAGDDISGNGYGDGRRDAAAKIRALKGK